MKDIDVDINKGIGKQNKACSVTVTEYDFSKIEKDLELVMGQMNIFINALADMAREQKEIKELFAHMTEQKALELALKRKNDNKKLNTAINSKAYKLIMETLDISKFMTTLDIISICNVSKPTALRLMRNVVLNNKGEIFFADNRGNEPARLFIKKHRQ